MSYRPTSEDIAMLSTTNAGKIKRALICRWFQENIIEIMCCVLIVACISCAIALWVDVWIETLPDPVLLVR